MGEAFHLNQAGFKFTLVADLTLTVNPQGRDITAASHKLKTLCPFSCSYYSGNYSANPPFGLLGGGDTAQEAIDDFYNSYEEMRELFKVKKMKFTACEFEFHYDVASFLDYYGKVLSLAGLERLTGINQGQLSHYMT